MTDALVRHTDTTQGTKGGLNVNRNADTRPYTRTINPYQTAN